MTTGGTRWTRKEIVQTLELEEGVLYELEREQIVTADEQGRYSETEIERLRICRTLRHDLGVNTAGIEVILNLLERIHGERRQFGEVLERLRDRVVERSGS